MAVLIEGISVVVRKDVLLKKFPGRWNVFEAIVPNQTLCADSEIVRVGFMAPQVVEAFINKLRKAGLVSLQNRKAVDIAVVDQLQGPTSRCDWLEFGHVNLASNSQRVAACQLKSSQNKQIACPPDWKYEGSMSASHRFVSTEDAGKKLKFLRHEDGVDVYRDLESGKEVYVGRPKQ